MCIWSSSLEGKFIFSCNLLITLAHGVTPVLRNQLQPVVISSPKIVLEYAKKIIYIKPVLGLFEGKGSACICFVLINCFRACLMLAKWLWVMLRLMLAVSFSFFGTSNIKFRAFLYFKISLGVQLLNLYQVSVPC